MSSIDVRVIAIEDHAFSFSTVPDTDVSPATIGPLALNVNSKMRFESTSETLVFRLTVQASRKQPSEEVLYTYSGEIAYRATGARERYGITANEQEYGFPADLIGQLFGLSLATVRGIVFARLGASPLRELILPILDTDHLMAQLGDTIILSDDFR